MKINWMNEVHKRKDALIETHPRIVEDKKCAG